MKLNWKNIDSFKWSVRANGFRYNNRSWSLMEGDNKCPVCSEPYMCETQTIHRVKFCSRKCQTNGVNNPNYNNRGDKSPLFKKNTLFKDNISPYDAYYPQLSQYNTDCRRNHDNPNILEIRCVYCNRWYIPSYGSVVSRMQSIKGNIGGDHNLYCSELCKYSCPTYRQPLYPKGFKQATSREVQPQLRKLVFERDDWECKKCGSMDGLHCHHITGVEINPIESADIDNCITLCGVCHKTVHKQKGCKYHELQKC